MANNKKDDNFIELKTAEGMANDVGTGIVRFDRSYMDKLEVAPGGAVELIGPKDNTVAIAADSYRNDKGLEIIRVDGYTRANAKLSIGEQVKVKKADVKDAIKVTLAPTQKGIRLVASGDVLKQNIFGRPVTKGDIIIPAPPKRARQTYSEFGSSPFDSIFKDFGIDFPSTPFSLGEIKFIVTNTVPSGIVRITEMTEIELLPEYVEVTKEKIPDITYDDIGGLRDEVKRVREMIELPLKHPQLFERLGVEPPKGVLLYGPPGTGKTLLAKAVANETQANFTLLNGPEIMSKWYGESEKNLRDIFQQAEQNAPSIIFIDEIDAIAPKREEVSGEVERRVVAQMLSLMDGLQKRGKVIVIAATNRPDSLDPALRRPGRFDREIEMCVPDRDGRREILQIHTRSMPLTDDVKIDDIAERTYGFVGADLAALGREAAMNALRRVLPDIDFRQEQLPPELLDRLEVTKGDFDEALKMVEPSALREVFVEIPNVRWEDIGDLEEVKKRLTEVVEWPLKHPESFKNVGIKPARGILLYGPPGTGKTLLAKAVANETKANFIYVKGSNVLSKWFGESEKKLAETFKKAKQAAPTLLFFDEIDALAPARGGMEGEPRVAERIVNTILTEMDGMEDMQGVVIIAATNRPDLLDPALLRPGRFDELVFVPAPNKEGRLKILQVHTKNMKLNRDVKLDKMAEGTEGFSGADIAALARKAGLTALREDINAKQVSMKHFEKALKETKPTITRDMVEYYEKLSGDIGQAFDRKRQRDKEMGYV